MAKNKEKTDNKERIESVFGKNDEYEYELRGNQIILHKYIGSEAKVQIPSKIGKNRVVRIGNSCFANNEELRKISISDGIKCIGVGAFKNCTSLWKVKLPESVTDIQPEAFMNCTKLHKFQFNETLEFIGAHAFDGCKSLRYVILPYSVSLISDHAFRDCSALNLVVIPYKYVTIKKTSFNLCPRLKKIVTPNFAVERVIRHSTFHDKLKEKATDLEQYKENGRIKRVKKYDT